MAWDRPRLAPAPPEHRTSTATSGAGLVAAGGVSCSHSQTYSAATSGLRPNAAVVHGGEQIRTPGSSALLNPVVHAQTPHVYGVCSPSSMCSLKAHTGFELALFHALCGPFSGFVHTPCTHANGLTELG